MTRTIALTALLFLTACSDGFEEEMEQAASGGVQWLCIGWCAGFYIGSDGSIQIRRNQKGTITGR